MEASLSLSSRDCVLVCAAAFLGGALAIAASLLLQVAGRSATKQPSGCAAAAADKIVARQRNGLFSNVLPAGQDVGEVPNGRLKPDPFDPSKRKGYLSWDDYFMAIAFLSAHRSKDPNRQVGACLVSQDRVILGIGYNGFPRGCSDDSLPWAKVSVNGDPLQTKYPYVCHAEVNAILNKNHASACGQRLYVTMFPCNECAKIIIQAGVAEVVYFFDKNKSSSDYAYIASRKLLCMAGVKVWQHQPAQQKIVVEFK